MLTIRMMMLVMTFGSALWGAETAPSLDVAAAVTEAREHSPALAKARAMKDESRWQHVGAWSGHVPQLSASASHLFAKQYMFLDVTIPGAPGPTTIPQIVPSTIFSLGVTWNLFDGFATIERIRAASAGSAAADRDLSRARFALERETLLGFFHALGARKLVDVAARNVQALDDHLRDVRLFLKAGTSTKYDVLRVEVQRSAAGTEKVNAEDQLEDARQKLSETMGSENDLRPLAGELPEPSEEAVGAVLKNADGPEVLDARDDLAALTLRTEALDHQQSASARFWVPRVASFGTYQYYNNRADGVFDAGYRDAYQVGLQLTWNLFDGLASVAQRGEVAARRLQTEAALRQAKLRASQDLRHWVRRVRYFVAVRTAKRTEVEKAEESVRLAKEGRKAGVRTNTDLLDAEVELYRAEEARVNATTGLLEAMLRLELATGKELYQWL